MITMHYKICFLLVVLFLIGAFSAPADAGETEAGASRETKDAAKNTDKEKTSQSDITKKRESKSSRRKYYFFPSMSSNSRPRLFRPASEEGDFTQWATYQTALNQALSNRQPPSEAPQLSPPNSLPASVFDSSTNVVNDPTCFSMVDHQYPIFGDLCATLPQTRYSLPNSFGHFERWQIAQVLTTILGTSTPIPSNPTCTRSLRLLICPLLFPPCPGRYEPPAVQPCQPFCQSVKAQCTAAALDLLPCDFLPPTSDLCPASPAPYGTFFSSLNQPASMSPGIVPSSVSNSPLPTYLAQSALSLALPQQGETPAAPAQPGTPVQGSQPGVASVPQQPGVQTAVPSQMVPPTIPAQPPVATMNPPSMVTPSARSFVPTYLTAQQQFHLPQQFYPQQFYPQQQYVGGAPTPILVNVPHLQYVGGPSPTDRYFPVTH